LFISGKINTMDAKLLMPEQFVHSDENLFCIQRIKKGRGFSYIDKKGETIKSSILIKRIKELAIPPMWSDVRICSLENGHLQAHGRDSKGRKQYIYHPGWALIQQQEKFAKMIDFGKNLPKIRRKVYQDFYQKGWPKSKILALMVIILDETGIRIGNKSYLQENGTYGLSTLRRKHLIIEENELIFNYKGKSNQLRQVSIDDEELISHIKKVADLPGYEIFRYQDDTYKTHTLDAHDVNLYLCDISNNKFSSKDFRTWVGSRLSVELLPEAYLIKGQYPRKKLPKILIKLVANQLGNTIAVCRSYYIHPLLLEKIENNQIPVKNPYRASRSKFGLTAEEKLLLDLIKD
jgi:DNA topoisomerase I